MKRERPLELAVGQSEGILPYAWQISARRRWRRVLNGSSMEEMKDDDVVERFHIEERV